MRKFISFALMLGLVMFGAGVTRRTEANTGAQLLTGILSKMDAAHRNLRSMRAGIVQQKVNSQIGTKDTDYGTLIYKPGPKGKGRMRIDYTKPDTRVLSIVGDSFVFYQPRINQVLKSTLAKASKGRTGNFTPLVGLDGSLKSLTNDFNVEYVREELVNGKTATQLRLTPKRGGDYASVDLWVNHETWLPTQYKIVDRNGDYTVVKLTNAQINVALNDADFNVSYPGGVKVVDKI
jgi:outer membrane lipoprotein-sorting protein